VVEAVVETQVPVLTAVGVLVVHLKITVAPVAAACATLVVVVLGVVLAGVAPAQDLLAPFVALVNLTEVVAGEACPAVRWVG
jgi:hypothetical protein